MLYRCKVNRSASMRTTSNGRPVGAIRACWIHVYDAIRAHPMCRNRELSGDRAVISEPTRCASTTGPRARWSDRFATSSKISSGPVLPQSGRSERPAASAATLSPMCRCMRPRYGCFSLMPQAPPTDGDRDPLRVDSARRGARGKGGVIGHGQPGQISRVDPLVAISCAQIRNRSAILRGYRNTFALCEARRGSLATKRAVAWRLRACSCYPRQRQQVRRT